MKAYITDPDKLVPPYRLAVTGYVGRYQEQKTKQAEPKGKWTTSVEAAHETSPSFLKVVGTLDKAGVEIVLLNSKGEVAGLAYSDTPVKGHVEIYVEVDSSIEHATQYIDARNHKILPSISAAKQTGEEDSVYILESSTHQIPSPLVYEDSKGSLVISKYKDNFVGEFPYESREDGLNVDAEVPVHTQGVKGDMYAVIGKVILDIRHVSAFNGKTYLIPFDMKPLPKTGKVALYTRKRVFNRKRLELTPATRTELGGVRVGEYLSVSKEGELSIDLTSVKGVLSLNEKTGHVSLLTRPVLSVNSEKPNVEGNVELPKYVLSPASAEKLGGVRPNFLFSINEEGILNVDAPVKSINGKKGDVYETFVFSVNNKTPGPHGQVHLVEEQHAVATKDILGVVAVGNGLSVDPRGVLTLDKTTLVTSVDYRKGDVIVEPYELPKATNTQKGGVTIGDYILVDVEGRIQYDQEAIARSYPVRSVNGKQGHVSLDGYVLQHATKEELGGVRVGANLIISEDGVLDVVDLILPDYAVRSVNGQQGDVQVPTYSLPVASAERLGGVRLGNGFKLLLDGTIYVDKAWLSPPTASRDRLGIVKIGDTLHYDTSGQIRVNTSSMPIMQDFDTYGYPILGENLGYDRVHWHMAQPATRESKGYVTTSQSREITIQQNSEGAQEHVFSSAGLRAAKKENEPNSKGFIIPGRFLAVENGYLVNKFPEVRVWSVNGRLGNVVVDGYVDKRPGSMSVTQENYDSTQRTLFVNSTKQSAPPIKEGYSNGYRSSDGVQYQQRQPDGGTVQVYTTNFGEHYRYIPKEGDWDTEPLVTDSPWSVRMNAGASREELGTVVYESGAFNQTRPERSVLERRLAPNGSYAGRYAGVWVITVSSAQVHINTTTITTRRPKRIYAVFTDPSITQSLRIDATNLMPGSYAPEIHIVGQGTVTLVATSWQQVIDERYNLVYVYRYFLNTEEGEVQFSGNGTIARIHGTYNYQRTFSTGQVRRITYNYNLVRILKQGR